MRCAPLLTVVIVVAITTAVAAESPHVNATLQKRTLGNIVTAPLKHAKAMWDNDILALAQHNLKQLTKIESKLELQLHDALTNTPGSRVVGSTLQELQKVNAQASPLDFLTNLRQLIKNDPAAVRRSIGPLVPIADNATPREIARTFNKFLAENHNAVDILKAARADREYFIRFIKNDFATAKDIMRGKVDISKATTPAELAKAFEDITSLGTEQSIIGQFKSVT